MKKILLPFLFFFALTISAQSNSDKIQSHKYSDKQIELFIREVFQDKADELVFKSSGKRLEIITDFLLNRINIIYAPEYRDKKIMSVLDVPLANKYNPRLERDLKISVPTFNPLKYDFPMFPKDKMLYRLGDADYLLMIFPATNVN